MTEEFDGARVLDDVAAFIGRFVVFPSEHCLPAVALWAAHTHTVASFYVTPRLVLDSAEPGSGKTRVLELLELLCANPEMTISATTAAIFRMLDATPDGESMTILFDEVDAIFNPKAGGNYEDLRALLNAGYKRGATIARCVGDAAKMKVQRFKVFAPVALAGIAGNMPATITTRSVTIHMRRRALGETVEPYRERYVRPQAEPIKAALATWADSVRAELRLAEPKMPDGVVDRPAEVWEALLAIADAAGGEWPERARAACEFFVLKDSAGAQSFGTRLLADLRRVFADRKEIPTAEVIEKLIALDEAPWADLRGKPLDATRLARALKPYEVAPVPFKDDSTGKTVRGYTTYAVDQKDARSAGLADAWSRYLPPPEPGIQRNGGNTRNDAGQTTLRLDSAPVTGVTEQGQVTAVTGAVTPDKPALSSAVTPVTPVTPKSGCLVCGEPIHPAAGSIHPNCEGNAA